MCRRLPAALACALIALAFGGAAAFAAGTTTATTTTTTPATTGTTTTGTTTTGTTTTGTTTTGTTSKKKTPPIVVPAVLSKLLASNAITQAEYTSYRRQWAGTLQEQKGLGGWRKTQLADVTALLNEIATDKQMTAARLPDLFLMLRENAQYWKSGAKLAYSARVQFPGSLLEWEYYPGYGLQLQVLGTFGEANGFYEAGPADYQDLTQVLNEMEQLAVPRAGGIAWEYYFNWEGGNPPWVSAMSQATGIEALTNGYLATADSSYLTEAHDALPLLEKAPPSGVGVKTPLGRRYLQYSFAPKTDIINAFLQTLIGLYDYGQVSKDPAAVRLFNQGNAQAQSELPSFVVSGWSLYQPGELDDLSYHELVTGFAQSLCQKLAVTVYCDAYKSWSTDMLTLPSMKQVTTTAPANKKFAFKFTITKPANVGITVSSGGKNFIYSKQLFSSGTHSFAGPKMKAGSYSLAMSVTDLVGHYAHLSGTLDVCKGSCPSPPVPAATPVITTTTTVTTTTPTTTTPTTTSPSKTSTTTTPTRTLTTTTPVPTTPATTSTTGGGGV